MMASNGFKPSKIAEILNVSRQVLNRFYKREMLNGPAAVDLEIYNALVSKALDPNNPKQSLKAIEIYYKHKAQLPSSTEDEDPEPKAQSDSVNSMIDPKKLSLEELRTLHNLLEKGKMEVPNTIIDAKVVRKD